LTYKIFEVGRRETIVDLLSGKFHRIGVRGSKPSYSEIHYKGSCQKNIIAVKNHREASSFALKYIKNHKITIDCIGHRFVHGGSYFQNSEVINGTVLEKLKKCLPIAPIHNPIALTIIKECMKTFPSAMQYVTFDSAFHSSIPYYAYTYALPQKIIEQFGFRKYGFHGLSYLNVAKEASRFLKIPITHMRIVACHLGTGGSSVAAIEGGYSIDTSMGYSPLSGLMMSTRCGDIDPMLAIYIMAAFGYRSSDLEDMLNKKSGLLGISGFSSDIRDITQRMSEYKEEQAQLAFDMYIHRLKKYIGSYTIILNGIDTLVFTDDIGVHNCFVREKICEDMAWCGLRLDLTLNRQSHHDRVSLISAKDSKIQILIIPSQEERSICLEGIHLLRKNK
jgi:acetate kinase